jgi:putative transcriptional regulator
MSSVIPSDTIILKILKAIATIEPPDFPGKLKLCAVLFQHRLYCRVHLFVLFRTQHPLPMPHQRLVAQQPQIGQIIRDLRQHLNLSQEKFAAHLGVSFQAVNRWENGRATPSPMAMEKVEKQIKKLGEPGKALLARHALPS